MLASIQAPWILWEWSSGYRHWSLVTSKSSPLGIPNGSTSQRAPCQPAGSRAPGDVLKWRENSGKHTKNYGKSLFLMGKSAISMAMFNSFLYVYRRVFSPSPYRHLEKHSNNNKVPRITHASVHPSICPQKNPISNDRPAGAFLVPRVVRRHLEISACLSSLRTNTSVELTKVSWLPSGYVKIAIENGPFIVDLPIKDSKMVIFYS